MAIRQAYIQKHPNDVSDRTVSFAEWLDAGVTLDAIVDVVSTGSGVTVSNTRLVGSDSVAYSLLGGNAPADVDITVTVETDKVLPTGTEVITRIYPVQVRA